MSHPHPSAPRAQVIRFRPRTSTHRHFLREQTRARPAVRLGVCDRPRRRPFTGTAILGAVLLVFALLLSLSVFFLRM